MMPLISRCALLAALPLLAVTGPALAQDAPLSILATVGMIADVATEVGGDCVAVTTLMGPGIDPHLYRPSARDVSRFQQAELVLYGGMGLEGQLGDVLHALEGRIPTLAVSEEAVPEEMRIATDDAYGVDPHVWMDASLWARTAPVIAEAIIAQRPDCADSVHANAEAYGAQLDALHGWMTTAIASIPEEQRVLVTAHDAFTYFGAAYGIDVAGIQGISTEAEASIADITATARMLADAGIPAIFVESTINPRTIQAVIEAAGQAGHDVTIGGELYADAMGETGTSAGTYIGMLHANTLAIANGLGGTPAPLPAALADWAAPFAIENEAQ